jgi:hypothetical protein
VPPRPAPLFFFPPILSYTWPREHHPLLPLPLIHRPSSESHPSLARFGATMTAISPPPPSGEHHASAFFLWFDPRLTPPLLHLGLCDLFPIAVGYLLRLIVDQRRRPDTGSAHAVDPPLWCASVPSSLPGGSLVAHWCRLREPKWLSPPGVSSAAAPWPTPHAW